MLKILHVLSALDAGGVEQLLFNYYQNMDRNSIHFDFAVHSEEIGEMEKLFLSQNSEVFHITPFSRNRQKNKEDFSQAITKNKYDIIHFHGGYQAYFELKYARKCGYKNIYLHSHSANEPILGLKSFCKPLLSFMSNRMATTWCACGYSAGVFQYGKSAMKKGKVQIINNAIDIQKFKFNLEERNRLRKELGIEDKFVIGSIGRLTYQKNQGFLIDVFKEVHVKNPKSVLLIAGDGEDKEKLQNQIKDLGLTECVCLLGKRNDVNLLYNAFDIFVLPSRYEGLGIVLIEATANGLQSLASNFVPKEVDLVGNICFLKLLQTNWVNCILDYISNVCERKNNYEKIANAGYDITIQAKKLEQLYLESMK